MLVRLSLIDGRTIVGFMVKNESSNDELIVMAPIQIDIDHEFNMIMTPLNINLIKVNVLCIESTTPIPKESKTNEKYTKFFNSESH